MRLLIITQKMDARDSVLGFMNRWVSEFAQNFESIVVICLERGEVRVPANVSVVSLGKEEGKSRLKYLWNFYRAVFSKQHLYDAVLVHMNQEYVLLGGLFWKLIRKKIYLWRNHYAGSVLTKIAALFCTNVFCTSKFSYTARYRKTILMPVGIDVEFYKPLPTVARVARSVLFYARIAPSKRPELLIEALGRLHARNVAFSADFYGAPHERDADYFEMLKRRADELRLRDRVQFPAGLPYTEGPRVYSAHEVFVNLSPSGMYDKTLFEAAACECMVLASSKDFSELVDERFVFPENDIQALSQKLESLLALSSEEKQQARSDMRTLSVSHHSLAELSDKLYKVLTESHDSRHAHA